MAATYSVPGTYATVAAAIAAIPADLSGQGEQKIEISSGTYTENNSIKSTANGGPFFNESSSDFISVKAKAGSEHKGLYTSGVILDGRYDVQLAHTEFHDMVGLGDPVVAALGVPFVFQLATDMKFRRCLASPSSVATATIGFAGGASTSGIDYQLCASRAPFGAVSNQGGFNLSGSGHKFKNCISWEHNFGFNAGNVEYINCAAKSGNAAGDFRGTPTGSNNISNDATAPGINSLINQSVAQFDFVDEANGDFHINQSSVMKGAGLDNSAFFTKDIDLETITTWMMGIDFPVVAGGGGGGGGKGLNIGIGIGL